MTRLVLIDAYGFLFRAYHALPPLINPKGLPVGAICGFINMLLKSLSEHKATHWVVVCDTGKKTFREDIYPEYKANRGEPDEELIPQFALLQEALTAFNMPHLSIEGYEADDVIATLAHHSHMDVTIISSDKDLMQLVSDKIRMFDPVKNKYIDKQDVIEKFGVGPEKLLDCFALIGDTSDNIPGVPGIGPKTAALLINEFGSLENLLQNAHTIKQNKRRETLLSNVEQAYLSRKLAKLCHNIDYNICFDDFILQQPIQDKLIPFLREHDFKLILTKVEKMFFTDKSTGSQYKNIETFEEIDYIIEESNKTGIIALYPQFSDNQITYLGMSTMIGKNYLITYDKIHHLQTVLSSQEVLKVGYDLKFLLRYINLNTFDDIDVINYSINTNKKSLQEIAYDCLGEQLSTNAALQAELILKIYKVLKDKLFQNKLLTIYERLDRLSIKILSSIEKQGILIDANILHEASKTFADHIKKFEQEIYQIAGHEFTIASPKQLAYVMFTEMSLEGKKKLKSGHYSTDSEVLESLAEQSNTFAEKVLSWRYFTKLKNTYSDALLKHINQDTNKIHTTYSLTTTATGRLSSSNPNLQNIPKNRDHGIRKAFIASPGHYLISADYSQIELRLLAHIANIDDLKQALNNKEDIHAITAQQIFGEVNEQLRRQAKAINFGIIYGISPFGLAKQLNISTSEAALYIKSYFEKYPGIENYMEETKQYAHIHGYVQTIYGRRCYVPDIRSRSLAIRKFSERAAINAPLQGSASDIMKHAMINLQQQLTNAVIVMQIHDELIIEVPQNELLSNVQLVKKTMENVIKLTVPLTVNMTYGENLHDLLIIE